MNTPLVSQEETKTRKVYLPDYYQEDKYATSIQTALEEATVLAEVGSAEVSVMIRYQNPQKTNHEFWERSLDSLIKQILREKDKEIRRNGKNQKPTTLEDYLGSRISRTSEVHPRAHPTNRILDIYPDLNRLDKNRAREYSGDDTDPASGAAVRYVSPYELPSGDGWKALGMYDPSTHTIYIANNLSESERRFVYHHAVARALGIHSEFQADAYAESRTGHSPYPNRLAGQFSYN